MISRSEAARGGSLAGARLEHAALFGGRVPERNAVEFLARADLDAEPLRFATLEEAGEGEDAEAPATAAERSREAPQDVERVDRARLDEARDQGWAQARQEFETELVRRLAEERRLVERMTVEFARDRQRFFAAAEGQVVRLALAVARKVLQRESVSGDGMPLRAAVKAALGRVQDASQTTLRVSESEHHRWAAMIAESRLAERVVVVADGAMVEGECVLETSVGSVELGIEAQMAEVGRSFEELMQDHA